MLPASNLIDTLNQEGIHAFLILADRQRRVAGTVSLLHYEHAGIHMVSGECGMPCVLSNDNRVATTGQVGQTVAGAEGDVGVVARWVDTATLLQRFKHLQCAPVSILFFA